MNIIYTMKSKNYNGKMFKFHKNMWGGSIIIGGQDTQTSTWTHETTWLKMQNNNKSTAEIESQLKNKIFKYKKTVKISVPGIKYRDSQTCNRNDSHSLTAFNNKGKMTWTKLLCHEEKNNIILWLCAKMANFFPLIYPEYFF